MNDMRERLLRIKTLATEWASLAETAGYYDAKDVTSMRFFNASDDARDALYAEIVAAITTLDERHDPG